MQKAGKKVAVTTEISKTTQNCTHILVVMEIYCKKMTYEPAVHNNLRFRYWQL